LAWSGRGAAGALSLASYVLVRRMDFFARWLLGRSDTDPDILLENERQHTPSDRFIE
jgi:hypothetical protein